MTFCSIIYLPKVRACLLDHLTPSLPVPTDDVTSRVFIQSSALERVVAIHPDMTTKWAGLVSSHNKSVKSLVYADKPQTLDHLEDNICRVIADIRPQMLEKVIENWTSRLDYIRASRGNHMPEILFKM
ncbi:hypothetical protein TNCV_1069001 [Trichonephila clavipes]|nr:hypothetical protein TNCV_1069001 [Trichonephila clavipes]